MIIDGQFWAGLAILILIGFFLFWGVYSIGYYHGQARAFREARRDLTYRR